MVWASSLLALLSLGKYSEQCGDERCLTGAIRLLYSSYLPFSEPIHYFVSLQGAPGGLEGKEAHPFPLLSTLSKLWGRPRFYRW
jgi:hypothetical protein